MVDFLHISFCKSSLGGIHNTKLWQLLTQKWPNIIRYSTECYSIFASIFASRSNTSLSNHHIFASPTIQLRYQTFRICLDNEPRSGTLLCRNLPNTLESGIYLLEIIRLEVDSSPKMDEHKLFIDFVLLVHQLPAERLLYFNNFTHFFIS